MKTAAPILMWAAICRGERTEWIRHDTIRRTRSDARKAYLYYWEPEYHAKALRHVRFARVVVAVEGQKP